jgi:hypothetical protein
MSASERVLPNWILEAAAQHEQPPKDLGHQVMQLFGSLPSDADWSQVQQILEQLGRDSSIEGILRRQREASLGIPTSARGFREAWEGNVEEDARKERSEEAQRLLAAELEAAEEEFRARAPEIAEKLPEVVKAAAKTPANSQLAQAARGITRMIRPRRKSRPYFGATPSAARTATSTDPRRRPS